MAEKRRKSGDQGPESPAKRRLEAIAASIGAILALATLGIIVWDGIRDEGRPALVTLTAGAVTEHESGYVVEVVARNSGDATAAALLVEGSLRQGDQVIETSETTFDYVPSRSQREGGLAFAADPRSHTLTLQAKGYIEP
ncbi:MAG TPA: TIGR02588 family protein [Propylenella sp.]|nr:TIGR02588 family protein [Propylenella sp.]